MESNIVIRALVVGEDVGGWGKFSLPSTGCLPIGSNSEVRSFRSTPVARSWRVCKNKVKQSTDKGEISQRWDWMNLQR